MNNSQLISEEEGNEIKQALCEQLDAKTQRGVMYSRALSQSDDKQCSLLFVSCSARVRLPQSAASSLLYRLFIAVAHLALSLKMHSEC